MAQSDESTLQLMYEYQLLTASNGQEYVVRGAEVSCNKGKSPGVCVLNLPVDHGKYTSDHRPLITVRDSGKSNVSGFGTCTLTGKACVPSLPNWYNKNVTVEKIWDSNTGANEEAVIKSAEAYCTIMVNGKFGTVKFKTSGQYLTTTSREIGDTKDISENDNVYFKNTELLGHIKVDHSGVYNLGFDFIKQGHSGLIFLYKKKSRNKLAYIGAYKILEHPNEKKEEFSTYVEGVMGYIDDDTGEFYPSEYPPVKTGSPHTDYWTCWIDLVLNKKTDYYIEVDCPDISNFYCKLIGNEDKVESTDMGMICWEVEENLKAKYPDNYDNLVSDYKNLFIDIILYLDGNYMWLLKDYLLESNFIETHSADADAEGGIDLLVSILGGMITPEIGNLIGIMTWMESIEETVKERLIETMMDYKPTEDKGLKLTFTLFKGTDNDQTAAVYYNNFKSEVWNMKDTVAKGPKYLKGEFVTFQKNGDIAKAIKLKEEIFG